MTFNPSPDGTGPTRDEVDRLDGTTLIEFGSLSCGHCLRAQPLIQQALSAYPKVRHLKIEDGRGRPLGRSFAVKLWPTLIVLRDGREVARVVRPVHADPIRAALAALDAAA